MLGARFGAGDSQRVKLRQAARISNRAVGAFTRICDSQFLSQQSAKCSGFFE